MGFFRRLDILTTRAMRSASEPLLRVGLAVVYTLFGALKLLECSPAEGLVRQTVVWADQSWFLPVLGWWEVAVGVCLLDPGRWLGMGRTLTRLGVALMLLHLPGTFHPLAMLPEVSWSQLAPTLEAQYIIKNLVLVGAGLHLGSRVRRDARDARARSLALRHRPFVARPA